MRLLMDASRAIVEADNADNALVSVMEVICETWGLPYAEVRWPTPGGDRLALRTAWTDGDPKRLEFLELSKRITYAIGEGHTGRCFQNNEVVWLPEIDLENHDGPGKRRQYREKAGLSRAVSVPIAGQTEDALGVINFYIARNTEVGADVVSIVSTISRQIGLFIEKKVIADALRENEKRFEIAAKAAGFGIWDYDIIEDRLNWDRRMFAIYGIAPEDFGGNLEAWRARVHEDDIEHALTKLNAAIKDDDVLDAAFRIVRPDGEVRHIRAYGLAIKNDAGHPVQFIGANLNVTEQRETEHRLNQAQKMEAVGQLTGGVAHDFNNLLTVIMGNLQLLERRVGNDERQANYVQMALDAARRGADLTQRLLAFSRRQVLEPKTADLNERVESMKPLLQRTLGEEIDLRTDLDENLPLIKIDVPQFESALLNLAVNARDAMPDGGLLVIETRKTYLDENYTQNVSELSPGNYVVVSVSDTGTGIDAEKIDSIFEPFFTTKETGKGSGLGLSMVYGFVKQSQGHVTAYSEPGEGTTIRLYFPAGDNADETVTKDSDAETGPATALGDETVLVVEDEEAVRDTMAMVLEDHGYRVVTAENGPEAVELLKQHDDFDLLLTDVVMPGGMNGRELAEEAARLRPDIRILITSGYPREMVSQKGVLDENIEFISKPYEHAELIRRIRELLDNEG